MEVPDELQINTVTQPSTQQNSEKPKPTCHHCKKPGHYRNRCRQLKREKDPARNSTNSANNKTNNGGGQTNSNSNNNRLSNNINANDTNIQKDRRFRPLNSLCETRGRTKHATEKFYLEANAANRPPPRNRRSEEQIQFQQRNAQNNPNGKLQAAVRTLN